VNKKLGYRFTDQITGFTGIATGFCEYISGCAQIMLTPRVGTDGAFAAPQWFDEQWLVCVEGDGKITLINDATPGLDIPAPLK